MVPKYVSVGLMIIGFIAIATAADAPCDNHPYEEDYNCMDHKGKWVLKWDMCIENIHFAHDGISGVKCIKSGYAFNTEDECKEKCKDAIIEIPTLGSPNDF